MTMKTIALAATLVTAPFAANAIGIAVDGGSYLIGACNEEMFAGFVIGDGDDNTADPYSVSFESCEVPADGTAHVTIGIGVSGTFENLVASWENGDTVQVTDAGMNLLPGEVFDLFTTFTAATNPQSLTFSWTGSTKGAGFDYEVTITPATVPLPAGILLLGTALAGLGFARRKA